MAHNVKHEVYLTDVPELFLKDGYKVGAVMCDHDFEIFGVNTEEDLAKAEEVINRIKK